jgi:hypothetical protein
MTGLKLEYCQTLLADDGQPFNNPVVEGLPTCDLKAVGMIV